MDERELRWIRRRAAVVAAHRELGSVSGAASSAGVSRKSAQKWIKRFSTGGEAALLSETRAPRTRTSDDSLEKRVLRAKVLNPMWGRRRLSHELGIGQDRVRGILDRGRIRLPTTVGPSLTIRLEGAARNDPPAQLNRGIEASLLDQPAQAIELIAPVWRELWTKGAWPALLRRPDIGPVLLRSEIQLGHSLMNTGDWSGAATWLRRTIESADFATGEGMLAWRDLPVPLSTRPDLVATEARSYLSTVLLPTDSVLSRLNSDRALHDCLRQTPSSENELRSAGNLLRSNAALMLTDGRGRLDEATRQLDRARGMLNEAGDQLMVAATEMKAASFDSLALRTLGERSRLRDLDRRLALVRDVLERHTSPMLRANFTIDAVRLRSEHGMADQHDADELREVASDVLKRGFGDQARKLIGLESFAEVLPLEDFRNVARLAWLSSPPVRLVLA